MKKNAGASRRAAFPFCPNANYPVVTKSYLIKQVFWLIPLITPSQLSPVAKSAINFNRTYSCEYSSGFSPGFPFNSIRRFDWKLDWCKVNVFLNLVSFSLIFISRKDYFIVRIVFSCQLNIYNNYEQSFPFMNNNILLKRQNEEKILVLNRLFM